MKNEKYLDMEAILPHRKPMVLIDRVLEFDIKNLRLVAEVDISEKSMFFDYGINGVPSWFGLEYMAQTIAALSGIYELEKGSEKPVIGFILGTRRYENNIDFFKNNETYKIEVLELFNNMELCNFSCIISNKDSAKCAYAELNVFKPNDLSAFSGDL